MADADTWYFDEYIIIIVVQREVVVVVVQNDDDGRAAVANGKIGKMCNDGMQERQTQTHACGRLLFCRLLYSNNKVMYGDGLSALLVGNVTGFDKCLHIIILCSIVCG